MILTRHRLTVEPNADFHHFFFCQSGLFSCFHGYRDLWRQIYAKKT